MIGHLSEHLICPSLFLAFIYFSRFFFFGLFVRAWREVFLLLDFLTDKILTECPQLLLELFVSRQGSYVTTKEMSEKRSKKKKRW
jgi:hypothetical protein